MKEKLKNIVAKWSLFEILFIICSVIIVTIGFVVGSDRNVYSYIVSIVGVLSVIFLAKGWIVAPIVGIVYSIMYGILAVLSKYYGEAIVQFVVMLPMNILTILAWLKHTDTENESQVVVNKISIKEYLIVFATALFVAVGMYYLLKALDTKELLVSTISLVSGTVAVYLSYRRSRYYAVAFLVADIVRVSLWCISIFSGSAMYLPTVLCFVMFIVSDIYGLVHWRKEENRQSSKVIEKETM